MKGNACFFTGHRKIPPEEIPELKRRLEEEIKFLMEYCLVKNFGAGGALGFDTLAAETVLSLKESFPQIKLILILPFRGQAKIWSKEDRERYDSILARADKVVYTSQLYYTGCYLKRNRHMADNSAFCISYVRKESGGAWYTLNYAKEKGVFRIEL